MGIVKLGSKLSITELLYATGYSTIVQFPVIPKITRSRTITEVAVFKRLPKAFPWNV